MSLCCLKQLVVCYAYSSIARSLQLRGEAIFGSRKNDSVINVQKVNFELLQSLCFKNYSMLFVKACMREQREQAAVLLLCKEKSQMCFYSQEEALASKTLNGVI